MPKVKQLISGTIEIQTLGKNLDSVLPVSNSKSCEKCSQEHALKKQQVPNSLEFPIMLVLPLINTFPNTCMVILYKVLLHSSIRKGGRAKEGMSLQPTAPQSFIHYLFF